MTRSKRLRVGLISGDGLAESGLLTVFRNAYDIGRELGLLEEVVPTDLGTTWRPDKAAFFPNGDSRWRHPAWMRRTCNPYVEGMESTLLGERLLAIREYVAELDVREGSIDETMISETTKIYKRHFDRWFEENVVDWVFALNMTLSDAVPATLALHSAADRYFASKRWGGVVYWDHDLFGSYAVRERDVRLYPETPNHLTPLPSSGIHTRWIVPSEPLAREAAGYPTGLTPTLLPNPLPKMRWDAGERIRSFCRQRGIDLERPILLNPVRVFHVKGVHLAVELAGRLREASETLGAVPPLLLVFGNVQEDPEYSRWVRALVAARGFDRDVIFLNGVPLASYQVGGVWHLDEIDLLQMASESAGGVVFTPGVEDVESIGLGPALAAIALVPCVVTPYRSFEAVYGRSYFRYEIGNSADAIASEAPRVMQGILKTKAREPAMMRRLRHNQKLVNERFDSSEWIGFWHALARDAGIVI